MPFSLRRRREIAAGQPLSIRIDQMSDGEYRAVLIEEAHPKDVEHYASVPQPSEAEALTLAVYERDELIRRRVDGLENEDRDAEVEQIECKAMRPRAWGGF